MSSSALRSLFSALHSPTQKPWYLVISPDPNTVVADKYALKLDSNFAYQQYELLIEEVAFAVNKTNSKKALPPFSNELTVGKITETDWLVAEDNTHGMFLQQALLDLLEAFPRYDLSSEKGTEATIHAVEVRVGNAAIFDGPSITADHTSDRDQSGPERSFIGKDDKHRIVLGCGAVVCILAVVYKYGMVPLLRGSPA